MKENNMEFGQRIKELRIKKNMSQEELAQKIGLQKSAIAKYENGRTVNMKRNVIFKMANVLECRPSYLMCMEDNPNLLVDTKDLHIIIEKYSALDNNRKDMLLKYIEFLGGLE